MSMRCVLLLMSAATLPLAAAAPAQDRGAAVVAHQSGMVGERYDGYLGLVEQVPEALRRQVGAINIKRRALYSDLAARRGVSPQEVGITAACQLLGRVMVGEPYLLSDNVWRRRAPGEGAPKPDYCG